MASSAFAHIVSWHALHMVPMEPPSESGDKRCVSHDCHGRLPKASFTTGIHSRVTQSFDAAWFGTHLRRKLLRWSSIYCRYTHQLGEKQWEYKDWIAEQCGSDEPKTEQWRRKMYEATGQNKREFPDRYRDVWRDDDLVATAKQDASKHSKELRAG